MRNGEKKLYYSNFLSSFYGSQRNVEHTKSQMRQSQTKKHNIFAKLKEAKYNT